MANQPLTGLSRLVAAFRNSRAGFRDVWKSEEAVRMECIGLVISVPLALWLASSGFQAALLVGSVLFVLIIEVLFQAIFGAIYASILSVMYHDLRAAKEGIGTDEIAAVFD